MTMSANEFLMGGGIPAAQFPDEAYGTTVGGVITTQPEMVQQTDLDDGTLKFWNDGKPMMQCIVIVQTEIRDPQITDDEGLRKFYIKANSLKAVREAVRRSGSKGLEVGGTLALTYTADGERKSRTKNPPKLYSATYQPPAAAAANAFLNGSQQPPAQQYAPQPAQGFVPPNQGPAPQWAAPAPGPIAQMPQQASQRADAIYQAAQQPAPAAPPAPADGGVWTPPPGMDPQQAAALANLQPAQRAQLGY